MTTKSEAKDPRQTRLAQALRENLKRRKAQMRERAAKAAAGNDAASAEISGQKA